MSGRKGSGYLGSSEMQISVANAEIIPQSRTLYKFSFMNSTQDCQVLVNNETTLFLEASMGFEVSEVDAPIYSFKILNNGISYYWIGGY